MADANDSNINSKLTGKYVVVSIMSRLEKKSIKAYSGKILSIRPGHEVSLDISLEPKLNFKSILEGIKYEQSIIIPFCGLHEGIYAIEEIWRNCESSGKNLLYINDGVKEFYKHNSRRSSELEEKIERERIRSQGKFF